jgi:hypothetical protein
MILIPSIKDYIYTQLLLYFTKNSFYFLFILLKERCAESTLTLLSAVLDCKEFTGQKPCFPFKEAKHHPSSNSLSTLISSPTVRVSSSSRCAAYAIMTFLVSLTVTGACDVGCGCTWGPGAVVGMVILLFVFTWTNLIENKI